MKTAWRKKTNKPEMNKDLKFIKFENSGVHVLVEL